MSKETEVKTLLSEDLDIVGVFIHSVVIILIR